jgi:hypothetical protein
VFLAGFAGVFWQWRVADTAQKETAKALATVESQKAEVERSEEAGRKLQYTTDMQLAPFLWKDDRTTAEQRRVLLARHIPLTPPVSPKGRGPGVRGLPPSPTSAALSGTTTSICWKTVPRFSRGTVSPSPTALSPRMVNS